MEWPDLALIGFLQWKTSINVEVFPMLMLRSYPPAPSPNREGLVWGVTTEGNNMGDNRRVQEDLGAILAILAAPLPRWEQQQES